jgi:phytol kinase
MDASAVHRQIIPDQNATREQRLAGSGRHRSAAVNQLASGMHPSVAVTAQRLPDIPLTLDARELARKLWHMGPGILALGLPLFLDLPLFQSHLNAIIVLATCLLFVLSLVHAKHLERPGERDWSTGVGAYAATVLIPLLAFPNDLQIAMSGMVILAFGDGAAALGGLALGGPPLPWNARKTLSGTLSFLICAAPMATWMFWGMADGKVSTETALLNGFAATAVAAIAESLPSTINDNIRVGAAGVTTLVFLHWLLPLTV